MMPITNMSLQNHFNNFSLSNMGGGQQYPPQQQMQQPMMQQQQPMMNQPQQQQNYPQQQNNAMMQ